jgi:hypothetical protein
MTLGCLELVVMAEAPQTHRFTPSVDSIDKMYDDVRRTCVKDRYFGDSSVVVLKDMLG